MVINGKNNNSSNDWIKMRSVVIWTVLPKRNKLKLVMLSTIEMPLSCICDVLKIGFCIKNRRCASSLILWDSKYNETPGLPLWVFRL